MPSLKTYQQVLINRQRMMGISIWGIRTYGTDWSLQQPVFVRTQSHGIPSQLSALAHFGSGILDSGQNRGQGSL